MQDCNYNHVSIEDRNSFFLDLQLPAPKGKKTVFAFALRKAGSVLFNKLIAELSLASSRAVLNLPARAFDRGLPVEVLLDPRCTEILELPGYVFSGFRSVQRNISKEVLRKSTNILLIRDPRDMLVSLYYSDRFSHRIPSSGVARDQLLKVRENASLSNLDDYIFSERSQNLINDYRNYIAIIDSNWRVYRYEDVIFNKRRWIKDLARDLDIRLWPWVRNKIADRNDKLPTVNNPEKHVRQVRPNNFFAELQPKTIQKLDRSLTDILDFHQSLSRF